MASVRAAAANEPFSAMARRARICGRLSLRSTERRSSGTDARDGDAQLRQRLVELREQACRAALQDLAGFRQIAAGVAPAEQRGSDLVLEPGDGLGDRRLRHVDRGGGPADVLGARHGLEYEQLAKARNSSVSSSRVEISKNLWSVTGFKWAGRPRCGYRPGPRQCGFLI